ncbi:MAG: ABC transporter substrate-binding protein [Leptothrix sp. (in: b-proteobacteria)]
MVLIRGFQRGLGQGGASWRWLLAAWLLAALGLTGCNNSPYAEGDTASNTLYSAFTERSPRHLDPTASYWNNETPFTYNIYEPPYGYHYLKRPYQLVPKTAVEVVTPQYLDKNGQPLPADAPGERVAESVYDVRLQPGILFQPHPAFAKDAQGNYLYHHLSAAETADKHSPLEFAQQGTRELVAEDYVYALKRHATTRITTPIVGIFSEYVLGLKDYTALIKREDAKLRQGLDPTLRDKPFLDFRRWPLVGATAPEKYLLRIRVHGKYPQWKYWMAMTFLAPIPWEADAFYAQPGMARNGFSLDLWPVGTGPYMMVESVQDRRHVLQRNPNYRRVPYPCDGSEADRAAGRLVDCGKPTPFIDRLVFQIEKEGISLKAKFRQGYLDVPQLDRDDWGTALLVEMDDSDDIKREYTDKGLQLPRFVDLNMYFIGFNMLDPVVGKGDSVEQQLKNRKLRQAVSIVIDWEEYSRIFPKDAGETAMSPLPAGLFGSRHGTEAGVNPVTHRWVDGKAVRRSVEEARQLLAEAGYPDGRDARSGKPLVLNYDFYGAPTPERKASFDWMIKQFAKIGVQLEIRATDNNQFQDKVRRGKHQIFMSGWLADYPDAENFLFLLYGPNGKSRSDGENTSNYENPEFDRRFQQLKFLDDGPAKQALIDEMVKILQQDAPWSWGYYPYSGGAYQHWLHNTKPSIVVRDQAKYFRVDVPDRVARQQAWNAPRYWPLLLLGVAAFWLFWLTRRSWRRHEQTTARPNPVAPEL